MLLSNQGYLISSKLGHILVFIVLILAKNPFFALARMEVNLLQFVILGFLFIRSGYRVERKILILIFIVAFLISIQGLIWGFHLTTLFTYSLFVVFMPYLLFRLLGLRIFEYLVNIIYFFSITSLLFWFMQVTIPAFDHFMQDLIIKVYKFSFDQWPRSLVFYTVAISTVVVEEGIEIYRNSGIFHEPGGYAIWLIVAIGLNTIITGRPFDKKNKWFVLALLTTFSTAGYLQLFVLLLYLIARSKIKHAAKVFIYTLFLIFSFFVYSSADFMSDKISNQYQTQSEMQLKGTLTTGRFIRIYKTLNVIYQSPIIGRGIISASTSDDVYAEDHMQGVATVTLFAKFGIVLGALYFLFFYKGIVFLTNKNHFHSQFGLFYFLALLLGGLSQNFFYDAISIQFFFFGYFMWRKTRKGIPFLMPVKG